MRPDGNPRVLQPQPESAARVPAQVDVADAPLERLEVGVPHPRDVAPVGDVVVEDREEVVLAGLQGERPQDLVRARRVLDQEDRELVPVHGQGSARPKAGATSAKDSRRWCPARSPARRRAPWRRARCRRCRGRGGRYLLGLSHRRGSASPVAPRTPSSSTCRARTAGRGARPAVRAVVVAEVPEQDRVVRVAGAAPPAVLGVRCVREAGQRDTGVVDAEVQGTPAWSRPRSATSGSSALSTTVVDGRGASSTIAAQRSPMASSSP